MMPPWSGIWPPLASAPASQVAHIRRHLAASRLRLGALTEAVVEAEAALALARATGLVGVMAEAGILLGEIRLREGWRTGRPKPLQQP